MAYNKSPQTPPTLQGFFTGIRDAANGAAGGSTSGKTKKAPQEPAAAKPLGPDQSKVPTATGSFYSRQSPDQRLALLQAMISRARGGNSAS